MEKLAAIFESGIENKRLKRIAYSFHLAVALDSAVDGFFFFLGLIHPSATLSRGPRRHLRCFP